MDTDFACVLQIGGRKSAEKSSTYGEQGHCNISCMLNFWFISSDEAISRYSFECY